MPSFLAPFDVNFVIGIDNVVFSDTLDDDTTYEEVLKTKFIRRIFMSRTQQIIDDESGEVLSSRKLKPNSNFVQIYRNEMFSIRELIKDEPKAANLFLFLTEKMDQDNAIVVSQETLSEVLGTSKRTIIRHLKLLIEKGFLKVIKSGTANVYLVNANIAWSSYANNREYAQFRASVFVSRTEQEFNVRETKTKQLNLNLDNKQ